MNKKQIFNKLITDMSVHAQNDYPLECCGIITTDFKYIPAKNISPLPKDSFILDPVTLLEHEDDTFGVFHSHPGDENPLPSEDDIAHTVFEAFRFIVGFADKFFIYWYDTKLEILRYEPFEEQHLDHSPLPQSNKKVY
jgi:proteasome lid subunit RPN8/RPN11